MITLSTLKNTSRPKKNRKRVGRGIASWGKTSGRGEKGAGSRSGWGARLTYEGGQMRLFQRTPQRGFSNARFRADRFDIVNLGQIDKVFQDGDVVNQESLALRGLVGKKCAGVKILGKGELTKKVTLSAHAISRSARDKLQHANIPFTEEKGSE